METQQFGKILIVLGILILLIGAAFCFGKPLSYLGRLPGDIRIEKPNFRFYFPITTSILLSILLSLIFLIFSRFR